MADILQQALEAEHLNRSLSYVTVADTLCGLPILPLTPRMRLELELAGNAFFTGRRAILGDVFDFFWRLNPRFARPVRPTRVRTRGVPRLLRAWQALGSLQAARHFIALERAVAGMDLFAVEREIHGCLARWRQDRPGIVTESDDKKSKSLLPPAQRHWLDNIVAHLLRNSSMSVAEILDTPLSLIYQLHRENELAAGREVIDPSASIASQRAREIVRNRKK